MGLGIGLSVGVEMGSGWVAVGLRVSLLVRVSLKGSFRLGFWGN